jgi:uncharacterized lipoprotein YbaY
MQNIVLQKSGHPINPITERKINMSDTPMANLDINKIFGSEVGSDTDVVKILFDPSDIEIKSELTQKETKIISKLELMADIIDSPKLRFVLRKYETLQLSKDRKSRSEVVQAIAGMDENAKTGGLMQKFGSIFKSDK